MDDIFWWYFLPLILVLLCTAHAFYIMNCIKRPIHDALKLMPYLISAFIPIFNIVVLGYFLYGIVMILILNKKI